MGVVVLLRLVAGMVVVVVAVLPGVVMVVNVGIPAVGVFVHVLVNMLVGMGVGEIGRASCRERV